LPFCYLTAAGRVSGRPHTIEIWFAMRGRTLYLLSGGGDRSDWVRNLLRRPEVTVRLGRRDAPALPARAPGGAGWGSRAGEGTGWPAGWSSPSTSRPTAATCPAGAGRPFRSRSTWTRAQEERAGAVAGTDDWAVERANAGPPRVGAALTRIRELVAEARRERDGTAGLLEGNGHPAAPRATGELRAGVESLTSEGIILRDLDAGLVDFPARLDDGREYLLCWALGEPAGEWWDGPAPALPRP